MQQDQASSSQARLPPPRPGFLLPDQAGFPRPARLPWTSQASPRYPRGVLEVSRRCLSWVILTLLIGCPGPAFASNRLKSRNKLVRFLTYSELFWSRGYNSVKNMVPNAALGPGLREAGIGCQSMLRTGWVREGARMTRR